MHRSCFGFLSRNIVVNPAVFAGQDLARRKLAAGK